MILLSPFLDIVVADVHGRLIDKGMSGKGGGRRWVLSCLTSEEIDVALNAPPVWC